jgi:NADPH-dependent 7-cyano-7-deazaguanine reductase QueF
VSVLTQPNLSGGSIFQTHILPLPQCCPISGNPQPGSTLYLSYYAGAEFLEVYSLRKYVTEYIGGRGDVRDMEGMIIQIARDCAATLNSPVLAWAYIVLQRGDAMQIISLEHPR